MTGGRLCVEGGFGLIVAEIKAASLHKEKRGYFFPETTAIGSSSYYITHADSKHFQPMNVNFGIIKELEGASK